MISSFIDWSLAMNQSMVSLARRATCELHSQTSIWRFFCSSSSPASNNKLFVGGLSWSVDEKTLKNAFSSYGAVKEVRIMYDKETGRSRGFGFVNFSKEDEAKSAKDAMDGKAFLGRPLRISFALDRVRGTSVVVPRFPNARET